MKYKNNLNILWGNKEYGCDPSLMRDTLIEDLAKNHVFNLMKQKTGATALVVAHQNHTINGYMIKKLEDIQHKLFFGESDFLITHISKVALAILTADCLPIILYDPKHHVVALIHAGWKGLTNGIVQNAIHTLQKNYQTDISDLELICGPAGKSCCYEVQSDFVKQLKKDYFTNNCFEYKDKKIFFSLEYYLKNLAVFQGIVLSQMDFSAHVCTICSDAHYSYRKNNKTPFRNITLVSLK